MWKSIFINVCKQGNVRKVYIYLNIFAYMDITTIRISKKLKKELRKLEVHPRETDEQIIIRLIKYFSVGSTLNPS